MSEENMTENTEVELEQPKFDPAQMERDMLQAAQNRADDPVETAGSAYQLYVPHFKRLLPKMSTRSLRRILQFLILYPLEKESVAAASEMEKQFMQMCNSLVEAKFVMIMASYQQNAEALYAAEQNKLTESEKTEVVDTLRAGGVSEEEIARLIEENKE
jgi:hypothetical protein